MHRKKYCVLLRVSIIQCREHHAVLIAQILHLCGVSLFISSKLFGANNKPCQGNCVVTNKKRQTERKEGEKRTNYSEHTENSEIDKNGKSLEKRK